MRCEEFAALLEIWLDGEPVDADALAAHEDACASCGALARARRAEREGLRQLLGATPPAGLREEILDRAEGEATGRIVRLPFGRGGAWILAAAAVLLLALGLVSLLDSNGVRGPLGKGGAVVVYLDGDWEIGSGIFEAGTLELPAAPGQLRADEPSAEGGSR